MSLQLIPLNNAPNKSFTVSLLVDGKSLTLILKISYKYMAGYWVMSIFDVNRVLLADCVPMITGGYPAANLLQQQQYLAIGSAYVVNVSNTNSRSVMSGVGYGEGGYGAGGYGGGVGFGGLDYPDNTNLGSDFELWWGDTPPI